MSALSRAMKKMYAPVSSAIKTEAARRPKVRQMAINLAQVNHRITTVMQRYYSGQSTSVPIQPLDEEEAVQATAEFIGELFIFSVAGGCLFAYMQRRARLEAMKEEKYINEIQGIKHHLEYQASLVEKFKKAEKKADLKIEELKQQVDGRK